MATVMKSPAKPRRRVPIRTTGDQLRKDRITAVVVLVAFAAVMALIIWLVSLGGGPAEPLPMQWPMM